MGHISSLFIECKSSLKHDKLETQVSYEISNINRPEGGWDLGVKMNG